MLPGFTKTKDNKKQSSCLPHFILLELDIDHFSVYFLIVTYSSIIFENNNFITHLKRIQPYCKIKHKRPFIKLKGIVLNWCRTFFQNNFNES